MVALKCNMSSFAPNLAHRMPYATLVRTLEGVVVVVVTATMTMVASTATTLIVVATAPLNVVHRSISDLKHDIVDLLPHIVAQNMSIEICKGSWDLLWCIWK